LNLPRLLNNIGNMKYCSRCGAEVYLTIPADDNRERYVCKNCGEIHYHNPKNVVGTIPVWENQILLCRRAIEPRKNFWTLPAGFLELQETTAEGAQRETLEETGANVDVRGLFSILNVPHIGQIHWFYIAPMQSVQFSPSTSESTEVALFSEENIPWDELAFLTVRTTLTLFFKDRAQGRDVFAPNIIPHLQDLRPIKS
jgi:ADP-ribose pyrophosphatase YjhB (NUDIX family)